MKKSLLAICAGVLAFGAAAQTYQLGEAFCYDINPTFSWFAGDDRYAKDAADGPDAVLNINWPAAAMDDAADLATNTGLATAWFAQVKFESIAEANELFPVVADPWAGKEDVYAIQMKTSAFEKHPANAWWGYGNLNFALPKMNEVSRIRVIYRADDTVENPGDAGWANNTEKPFWVRLTDTDQDGCFKEPMFSETNIKFWETPGYRVVDLYYQPNGQTYLALTYDSAGLSCQGIAMYVEEVSVVPVSKLEGDTHVSGDVVTDVVETLPELVKIEGSNNGEDSINEIAVAKQAGIYDLQGRKLAAPAKGINIINGVKTLVK